MRRRSLRKRDLTVPHKLSNRGASRPVVVVVVGGSRLRVRYVA